MHRLAQVELDREVAEAACGHGEARDQLQAAVLVAWDIERLDDLVCFPFVEDDLGMIDIQPQPLVIAGGHTDAIEQQQPVRALVVHQVDGVGLVAGGQWIAVEDEALGAVRAVQVDAGEGDVDRVGAIDRGVLHRDADRAGTGAAATSAAGGEQEGGGDEGGTGEVLDHGGPPGMRKRPFEG